MLDEALEPLVRRLTAPGPLTETILVIVVGVVHFLIIVVLVVYHLLTRRVRS